MTQRKYGQGWFNESERHGLSAKGIKTGRKVDYSLKGKLKWGAIGAGAGALATTAGGILGKVPSLEWSLADFENFLVDVVGVTGANVVRVVPYVAIGGIVLSTGVGIKKLIELHHRGHISKQQLKSKIKRGVKEKKPIIVEHHELVKDKSKVKYAKEPVTIKGKTYEWAEPLTAKEKTFIKKVKSIRPYGYKVGEETFKTLEKARGEALKYDKPKTVEVLRHFQN